MSSGNFLIGSGLEMQTFNEYVAPLLQEKKFVVADRLSVPYKGEMKVETAAILTSISGEGNLEETLNAVLVQAGVNIEKEEKKKESSIFSHQRTVWSSQVSKFSHYEGQGAKRREVNKAIYETRGLYENNATASQLFPFLAQEYLAKEVHGEIEKIGKRLNEIGTKLSNMS